ncbi:MAG: glycosyltransferase family 87 protein, partial [Terriglobales bacterium]
MTPSLQLKTMLLKNPSIYIDLTYLLLLLLSLCWLNNFLPLLASAEQFQQAMHSGRLYFFDFAKYYMCGQIMLSPDHVHPYDFQPTNQLLVLLTGRTLFSAGEQIDYAPESFLLMTPFAALSPYYAFIVWALLGVAGTIAGTYLLCAAGKRQHPVRDTFIFMLALFGSLPALRAMEIGQISFFIYAGIALLYWALLTRKDFLAGVLLAFVFVKPQYALFLLPFVIVTKRWKTLIAFTVCGVILFSIAAAWMGLGTLLHYPGMLAYQEPRAVYTEAQRMVNFRGILAQFLPQATAY